jgi:hypothetical protein
VRDTSSNFISEYFGALITFAMASKHTNNRTSGASLEGKYIACKPPVWGMSIKPRIIDSYDKVAVSIIEKKNRSSTFDDIRTVIRTKIIYSESDLRR